MKTLLVFIGFIIYGLHGSSISDLKDRFGNQICIEGTLFSSPKNNEQTHHKTLTNDYSQSDTQILYNSVKEESADKTALSQLHELAQFNKIAHEYELLKEDGPAHNRIFTVKLLLGDEHYIGKGNSLKKAQRQAAAKALEKTEFQHPIVKEQPNKTPTVLLNNVAAQLGVPVKYYLKLDIGERDITIHNVEINEISNRKSYLEKLNNSLHDAKNNFLRAPSEDPHLVGPFTVRVQVSEESFIGVGHTVQAARHNAAIAAMKGLRKEQLENMSSCLKPGQEAACRQAKDNLKSPISLVYETAQRHQLTVQFDVDDGTGKDHKKVFKTKCTLGNIIVEGEGKSKKESKRVAAENMLQRLSELPPLSDDVEAHSLAKRLTKEKKSKKKKKNKIIKNTLQFNSIMGQVVDFFTPDKSHFHEDSTSSSELNDDNEEPAPSKPSSSSQSKLDQIRRNKNMNIQYSDFEENENHVTILSLDTKPPFMCLGEDVTKEKSRDKAAEAGLKLLDKLGLSFILYNDELDKERQTLTSAEKMYWVQTEKATDHEEL